MEKKNYIEYQGLPRHISWRILALGKERCQLAEVIHGWL